MKTIARPLVSVSSLPLAICLAFGPIAQGALYWDGGITGGTGDGASAGGSGTWSTAVQNWDAGNGVARVVWTDGNDAVFAGSGGTVTLGTAITAGTISIGNNDYTIATAGGAALTLTNGITASSNYHQITNAGGLALSGASQAFNITGGLRISTAVSGSATITKTGTGMLSFTGANSGFTGKIIVNAGRLGIGADSALGAVPGSFTADSITLNGGTLVDGIVNNAVNNFDNGGIFTINANRGITLGASGGSIQVGYGAAANMTVAGIIAGTGTLTKTNDDGTLTLTANNSYSGTTTISGGTLQVGNGGTSGTLGSGSNVVNNAALVFNRSDTYNFNSANNPVISGTGTLTQAGTGTLILTGANTYSGTTTISAGTLQISNNGVSATIGSGNIVNNATLLFNRSNGYTVNNVISGTGVVAQTGGGASGVLTLTGANTYSGGTMINSGSVVSGARSLGRGVVSVSSGATLSVSQSGNIGLAGQYFNVTPSNVASVNPNFNSQIALQSHLAGVGQPAVAVNTTSMNFGTTGGSFPTPYNSGASNFESYYSGMINIGTAGNYTFNTSSDDGSVLFIDGAMVVNNNFFQGYTTKTSAIALTAGMHNIAYGYYQGGGGYGFNAQISGVNNTTMVDLNTTNAQITPDLVIGSLSGAGSVALTTGNLILGQDNTNQTFSGVISGIGGVNKWGTGTQTFSGANTYSGTTSIYGGTLKLGANNVTPDGSGKGDVAVYGTFDVNGFSDTINGLSGSGIVSLSGASALSVGNNNITSDFSGNVNGNYASFLIKVGSGTQTLSGSADNAGLRARVNAGTLLLAKTSSGSVHSVGSTGGTDYALTITDGTAKLGGTGGDQIFQNSSVNMTGGTFDLAGVNEGFDGLSGSAGTITNSTASTTSTLTLGQNSSSGSPSFGGIIKNGNGTIGLTKTGSGTQTLTGANTYSGQTNVSAGTLAITAGGISGGTVNQTIIVNDTGTGTAALTQSGGAVSAGTGEIWIGQNSGSTGIYNLSVGTLASSNWLAIGRNFATGTLNITGSGALTHTGSQHVTIGSGGGGAGNGTVNQTGGSIAAASEVWLGETGTANYNISGGTVNANGGLRISRGANPGTLTLQNATGTTAGLANGGGNEVFTTTTLLMSESAGASTVNLDGGTLVVTQIASAGGAGTKTLNFNGGTLKANSGANATFMTGLTSAFVKSAGAIIDTYGQTITISQPLLTDVTSTGGGLTKSGAGILTLSGTNTYTGGTTLSGGTLALANNGALGTGALTMGNGTTLANFDSIAHTISNIVFSSVSGMTATISTTSDLTLTGSLSGATNGIQITKQGTGTLTIPDTAQSVGSASSPAVWTITGGGTLSLTRGNNLGTLPTNPTVQVILDNGTFKTNTAGGNFFSQRTMQVNAAGGTWLDSGGGVNFDGTITNSGSFTIDTAVSDATTLLNGAVSGSGSLIKSGGGALILGGANTYTGISTINAGNLTLTGSLSNTAISVASGAIFSPTVTTSAGLGSGSAGASLTLNSGAILDMTSTSAGTINTFTLNPGSNSFAGQALNLSGANLRFDLGSNSADGITVNSGTAAVGGTNNVRFNTGSILTAGTYNLISAASGLAGTFQFDGGSSLSVPAQQQIKNVGGANYRLTLQNSETAEQVIVSDAPSNVINIMPLGSSITEGVTSQPGNTYAGGGYRSQLYQNLVNDGRFTPHFVGSQTVLDAQSNGGYNVLTGANELNHEGHSGYTTTQILKNLNANGGDAGNNDGLWLAPANGKNPDYVTLSIGGNDYGANGSETTAPLLRTDAIVSQIASLRPDAHVIVSNLFYRTQTSGGNVVGDLQNTYYNPGVQEMVFNHVLAGQHVSFYDAYSAVTPGKEMSHIFDGIHPDQAGYNAFANGWYDALANGSAFWRGGSGGAWNNQTNFAQNYQRTTARQTALTASTDVHFNGNASPLTTTLGGDISVRSLNFAAGAAGAVTVGGTDALTLGAGGITVQAGTGAHTVASHVVLGTNQTWGNVSSNPLAVTGNISGSGNLTIVGSAVVQLPGTLSGSTYTTTTQTVSGAGAFVLSGANTYTGSTTISSGTLQIGDGGATGSLASSGTIANNGSLVFNRTNTVTQGTDFSTAAITGTGSLTQAGSGTLTLTAANTYSGQTLVQAGTLKVTGSIATSSASVGTGATIASGTTGTLGSSLIVSSGGVLAPGDASSAGIASVMGATKLNNNSIFSWDISSDGVSYDKLVTGSLAGDAAEGDAIFRIVAADANFSDAFWNQTRMWNDIFTTNGTTPIANWADLFTPMVVNSSFSPVTPGNGSFSVSGSTLTWSAVPEPTSALAGLLIAAGLLRRRRAVGISSDRS